MKRKSIKVTCELCGSSVRKLLDPQLKINQRPLAYDVCEGCGFTKKESLAYLDHVEEKRQYDFHENSIENEGYKTMLQNFLSEAVTPFIKKGWALEYGSGPGPVLGHLLQEAGFEVFLYDPFYYKDLKALEQTYDLITSTEVFEHFHQPLKSIQSVINLLKTGGILAVQTSFRPSSDEVFLSWWYRRDLTHVSFYTLESFKKVSAHLNCEILYTNQKNIIVLRKR